MSLQLVQLELTGLKINMDPEVREQLDYWEQKCADMHENSGLQCTRNAQSHPGIGTYEP